MWNVDWDVDSFDCEIWFFDFWDCGFDNWFVWFVWFFVSWFMDFCVGNGGGFICIVGDVWWVVWSNIGDFFWSVILGGWVFCFVWLINDDWWI